MYCFMSLCCLDVGNFACNFFYCDISQLDISSFMKAQSWSRLSFERIYKRDITADLLISVGDVSIAKSFTLLIFLVHFAVDGEYALQARTRQSHKLLDDRYKFAIGFWLVINSDSCDCNLICVTLKKADTFFPLNIDKYRKILPY